MYLLNALKKLPLSIVLTTLAVVSTTIGEELRQLTPANFKESTAHGLWFVEHFSPYCGHCKRFEPTWKDLVNDCETEIPSVQLAQVNCAQYGDLCNENKIKLYPTIFMYEDGKMIEEYDGNRKLDDLKQFLKRHAKVQDGSQVSIVEIEEEPQPLLNINGEVLSINDPETFTATLEKGPAFIKFFAPWCGHCKKLAPIWVRLAADLKGKVTVAEVDCDANSALCSVNKIQGYPTLVYFAKGMRSEYTGGRKLEQLKSFVEKAAAGGLHPLHSDSELSQHIQEYNVMYLFLYSPSSGEALQVLRDAAPHLLGSPPVFTSHSQDLYSRYGVPSSASWALLAFKDHDSDKPAGHLHGLPSTSLTSIHPWLMSHRIPSYLELSSDTFQSVMNAQQGPLVLIAAVTEEMRNLAKPKLQQLAKEWRAKTGGSGEMNGKEVVFTSMDAEIWKDWLKSMYGIKKHHEEEGLDDIKVIIADHKQLVYYDEDVGGHKIKLTSTQKLFATLERATAGHLHYKHSQNAVERLARYLNHKMTGIEFYVTAYPFRSVFFIVGTIAVVFYLLFRWLGSDMQNDRENYKSSRLD